VTINNALLCQVLLGERTCIGSVGAQPSQKLLRYPTEPCVSVLTDTSN